MKVLKCQEKWEKLESDTTKNNPPQFFWLYSTQVTAMLETMLAPVQKATRLGSLPIPYTQNAVESVNNLCKAQDQSKKYDWATVNTNLKSIALEQRTEGVKALYGSGVYTLSDKFKELEVPPNVWRTASKSKKLGVVNQFKHFQRLTGPCSFVSITRVSWRAKWWS